MKIRLIGLVISTLLAAAVSAQDTAAADAAAQQAALAKQSQNPVANVISVPIEFWHYDGKNGTSFATIVKPVIPTSLGKINLVNRFILPYMSIDGALQPPDPSVERAAVNASGLANITYQGFLSPAKPGKVIWGLGVALEIPTATDDQMANDLWSVGPSVLALTMPSNWVLGILFQNVWDFAGSGDGSVNKMTLQPILNFNLAKGWYLTSTPVITANWDAGDNNVWTVPVGAGVGKMSKFGKQPVDLKIVYYNYVEKPTFGADWSVLFSVKLLFPK